jgi:glycogen debranching enzyme
VRATFKFAVLLAVSSIALVMPAQPQAQLATAAATGLVLERPSRAGAFVDVVGRRAAFVGYEHRGLEAWVYPLKLLDDLRFAFRIEGYPQEIDGNDILARIMARPESTTLTYAHAAFTSRVTLAAPVDEAALVILVETDTTLPVGVTVSFRPRLALMWPAGLQTGNIGWNASARAYELTEESGRYAGLIGSPAASEGSLMPYQEEPRGVPVRLTLDASAFTPPRGRAVVVINGGVQGVAAARRDHERVRASIPDLLSRTVDHYRNVLDGTLTIDTPDDRVDTAFSWAKVGVDKGLATNPFLGTGLIAGFRTSGESERPGFAWYFGRDALWTALAMTAYGDLEATRTALDFLRRHQRDDGKIPHEISQSATLIPWFTEYPYAWASADATPLFLVGHADYWRASGDRRFLQESWPALVKAWEFSAATDRDGDALIENTGVGHGWVEGGALYPPHEEIYLQGVWVAAQAALAELAGVLEQPEIAARARAGAERTRAALETTFWRDSSREYLYATKLPRDERILAEPGPARERRQARLDRIAGAAMYEETTVLPAVPLWWRVLRDDRADEAIDVLGGGSLASDWGHRLLSSRSALYDPLSYHYGSVWPLFTGWAAVGAYQYGRAHVGYQGLMANALLTDANALGYVTELLSGDFQAPFGRSSHHQIWSEAMVVNPLVRGLLGIDRTRAADGTPALTFAPQLPADWDDLHVRGLRVHATPDSSVRYDVHLTRRAGERRVQLTREGAGSPHALVLGVWLPLDARAGEVVVDGRRRVRPAVVRRGDSQMVSVTLEGRELASRAVVAFAVEEGTDVYRRIEPAPAGAASSGLRILRSRAERGALDLRLEGLGGREYVIHVRTSRRIADLPAGVRRLAATGRDTALAVAFDGSPADYVRRDVRIPLSP